MSGWTAVDCGGLLGRLKRLLELLDVPQQLGQVSGRVLLPVLLETTVRCHRH